MIRIEVNDEKIQVELDGTSAEIMADITRGVLCALKSLCDESKMPFRFVFKTFIKGIKVGYKNMPEYKEEDIK